MDAQAADVRLPDGRLLLGWREHIALPEWGIRRILAKTDTGARSSAVHAEDIVEISPGVLEFDVVLSRHHRKRRKRVTAPIVRRAGVRSSNGVLSERHVVETLMRLGPVRKRIEITLVARDLMACRMLLGRSAMEGSFVVDPQRAFVWDAGGAPA